MYTRKMETLLVLFLVSSLLSACIDDKTKPESDVPPKSISLSVTPAATTLPTGGTVVFTADVKGAGTTLSGAGNSAVIWRVDEGASGGTVTSKGGYTAPGIAGTFHVTAESQVDNSKMATSTVTVSTALDVTFGQNGKVRTGFGGNAMIKALAEQSDGKVLAGGKALNGDSNSFALARYQSNGSLDTTFGTEGIVATALNGSQINALAVQPDGKILATGFAQGGFGFVNNVLTAINAFVLVRYHSDGSLDTSFGSGGIVKHVIDGNSEINALKILSDGKILVAGFAFNTKNKDNDFVLARYHPDGKLDTSFGAGGTTITDFGGKDDKIAAMVLQAGGKIVVGGVTSGGNEDFALARYRSNGTLDTSFGTLGKTTTDVSGGNLDGINALALQADEKIIAGGFASNSTNNRFALVRYDLNGNILSTTITDVSTGTQNQINVLKILSDEKIVAGGFASNGTDNDFVLTRYDVNGNLLSTTITNVSSGVNADQINALLLKNDGAGEKIIAAGFASNSLGIDFALAQYNANGTLDATASFGAGGIVKTEVSGGNEEINGVAVYQAGVHKDKIVATGFSSDDFAIARYTRDGAPDPAFSDDGLVTTAIGSGADKRDRGNAVAIYNGSGVNENKVVVGGVSFSGSNDDFALVRYNANGSPDTTFGVNGNGIVTTPVGVGNDAINALKIQTADGKIVVAGTAFTGVNNNFALARYKSDGTLDAAGFGTGGTVTTQIGLGSNFGTALVIHSSSGKIFVAGHAALTNGGDFDFAVARYSTGGVLETTFTAGVGNGHNVAAAIALHGDKVIVGGGALTGDAAGQFILVRFLSDGTLDTSFGSDGIVTTQVGESEGRVMSIHIDPSNGEILAAGFTSSVVNKRDFALVRYNSDGSLDTTFGVGGIEVSPFSADIDEIHGLALQSNGKIVAAGTAFDGSGFNADFHLARYTP